MKTSKEESVLLVHFDGQLMEFTNQQAFEDYVDKYYRIRDEVLYKEQMIEALSGWE